MPFAERLDPATYSDDVTVDIVAVSRHALPGPLIDVPWSHVSERLWARILHSATPYELHIAALLEPTLDTVLNHKQCESAAEELRFLLELLHRDAAVRAALSVVLDVLDSVRGTPDLVAVFSPP